jgi:hypothetical protein
MCGRHEISNNDQTWATNVSSLSPPPLLHYQGYFIPSTCIYDWESRSSEVSSSTILHRERVNKVLWSDLHDCSLTSSSFSSRLIYLFVGHMSRVTTFNVNSVKPIVVVKEPQVTYGFFSQIMSLDMLIYVGIILLVNILQWLLFIAVIDLSRTCDNIASLICNVLLMFMIYFWIKIKLKLLIFSRGQPSRSDSTRIIAKALEDSISFDFPTSVLIWHISTDMSYYIGDKTSIDPEKSKV